MSSTLLSLLHSQQCFYTDQISRLLAPTCLVGISVQPKDFSAYLKENIFNLCQYIFDHGMVCPPKEESSFECFFRHTFNVCNEHAKKTGFFEKRSPLHICLLDAYLGFYVCQTAIEHIEKGIPIPISASQVFNGMFLLRYVRLENIPMTP